MTSRRVILFDDVFFQFAPRNSGVARIWRDLLTSSAFQTALSDNDLEVIILSRSGVLDGSTPFRSIPFPTLNHQYWALDSEWLDLACESLKARLFVSSYFTFPTHTPTWMWCYDLIPERLGNPAELHYSPGWQQRQIALLNCQNFVSISKSTSNDLNSYYPHSKTEFGLDVAYPWLSSVFRRSHSRVSRLVQKRGSAERALLLMVGSRHQIGGYKNGSLVFKAIEKGALAGYQLIFVGGEPLTEEEKLIGESNAIPLQRVVADDHELIKLYRNATALIHPSQLEGFGLPVIEALSCGTPVICQHSTSLPEAGGECAVYLKENSVDALVDALGLVQNKFVRKNIEDRGPVHALSFSQEMSVKVLVASLVRAIERPEWESPTTSNDFDLAAAVKLLSRCQI